MLYPLILATALCMYGWIYFNYLDDKSIPRTPPAAGERLNFSQLRPTEEIVMTVEYLDCRGSGEYLRWKYYITGDAPARFQASAKGGYPSIQEGSRDVSRLLTITETEGLDVTLQFLRSISTSEIRSGVIYNYSYFRAGEKIGEESFSIPWFIDELNHLAIHHEKIPQKADWAYEISRHYGISREDIDRLLTPEMLAAAEPINTATTTQTDKKTADEL